MRIAILDDYQGVALSCAGWDSLPGRPEITVFTEHIARHEALAAALRPFEVIVAMRERTPFGAGLLSLLPDLRLLVTTGMANAAVDLAATRERGVTVCGTGGIASATAASAGGCAAPRAEHGAHPASGLRHGRHVPGVLRRGGGGHRGLCRRCPLRVLSP